MAYWLVNGWREAYGPFDTAYHARLALGRAKRSWENSSNPTVAFEQFIVDGLPEDFKGDVDQIECVLDSELGVTHDRSCYCWECCGEFAHTITIGNLSKRSFLNHESE